MVTDSDLAGSLGFWGRWGNSCGMPFYADRFLAEHTQWSHLKGYLRDRVEPAVDVLQGRNAGCAQRCTRPLCRGLEKRMH